MILFEDNVVKQSDMIEMLEDYHITTFIGYKQKKIIVIVEDYANHSNQLDLIFYFSNRSDYGNFYRRVRDLINSQS